MIHRQIIAGLKIDLFAHIYFGIIEKLVKDFKTHRCALGFDILLLGILVKEKNNEIKITYLSFITHEVVKIW